MFEEPKFMFIVHGHAKWLQNKLSLIPFMMRVVVFALTTLDGNEREIDALHSALAAGRLMGMESKN